MNIDTSPLVQNAELDIAALLSRIRRHYRVALVTTAACLVLSVIYLHLATYNYTAVLKVGPAQSLDASGSGPTSGGGALSGLASLAGLGNSHGQSVAPFQVYLETIASRETGDRLARNPDLMHKMFSAEWDASTSTWRRGASVKRGILNFIRTLLGVPLDVYHPPDGARMQALVQGSIGVEQDPKKSLVTLSFSAPDPQFAVYFLGVVNKAADDYLRQKAQQHADQYINYLNDKLATVSLNDHRLVLMQVMSEQERFRMMASSNLPYAADIYDGPAASPYATSPKPAIVLALGLISGVLLGCILALLSSSAFAATLLSGFVARPRR
jgi:hypothetical protein